MTGILLRGAREVAPAVLCVAAYMGLFVFLYIKWMSPSFEHLGFHYDEDASLLSIALICIALVMIIVPYRIQRAGDFLIWIILLSVFIPAVLSLSLQNYGTFCRECTIASLVLSFSCAIFINRYVYINVPEINYRTENFIWVLNFLLVASILFFLFFFWNYISLHSFLDVYAQRFDYANHLASMPSVVGYLVGWLAYVVVPFLLAIGLFDHTRRYLILVAFAAQVVLFTGFAGKMMLVVLGVQVAVYLLVIRDNELSVFRIAAGTLALIMSAFVVVVSADFDPTGIWFQFAALIYMRTLAIEGALTGTYADFYYSVGEFTWWSHSRIASWLIEYPHPYSPGQMVGNHMHGDEGGMDANAHFWATDGIAAAGNLGVLVMGPVLGVLLVVVNAVARPDRLAFACVALIPFAMALGNTSLFQSVLTGGGALMLLLIYFVAPRSPEVSGNASQ